MKMKNKLLSAALAASMVVPMAMPIMAADDTKNTTLKYSVTEGYSWTIHSDIDFGKNTPSEQNGTVSVDSNIIGDGKKLTITAKGNGGGDSIGDTKSGFKIANGNTTLNYSVKKERATINEGDSVLEVNAGTNSATSELTFALETASGNNVSQVAGEYTGKIIYTASIVSQ